MGSMEPEQSLSRGTCSLQKHADGRSTLMSEREGTLRKRKALVDRRAPPQMRSSETGTATIEIP
eukprot:1451340-Alexandrium_andersonii.AAC.1